MSGQYATVSPFKATDYGARLPLLFRVNRESVREAKRDENNRGRIPPAHITFGYLSGAGWTFLPPWAQKAMGRHDDPYRFRRTHAGSTHAPFLIVRLWSRVEVRPHFLPQCHYAVQARFYRAIVWRKGRGWAWTWVD